MVILSKLLFEKFVFFIIFNQKMNFSGPDSFKCVSAEG